MKYYELYNLTKKLNFYNRINVIKRIKNNILKLQFDKKNIYYFDMTKGNSYVYKKISNEAIHEEFNAPFDVMLKKKFTNSIIRNISLVNNDKILSIEVKNKNSYKQTIQKIQFEFTGRHTNCIILDEKNIIIDALRHIDHSVSSRMIKVGIKLDELKKPDYEFKIKNILDIDKHLLNIYIKNESNLLEQLKEKKIFQINKQVHKLNKILCALEDTDILKKNASEHNQNALNILNTIYNYSGYEKQVHIKKSNDLFNKSKKLKQKVLNQHIESVNIIQKIEFFTRLASVIKSSKTCDQVEFYSPRIKNNKAKTKKMQPYKSFFIGDYKIMLGRDERENIYLLENSKASDFWFHLKGIPSSHLIVSNTKKTIPQEIVEKSAYIVAKFSTNTSGKFLVDFTQRRNVKIQYKANVLYNPYSTIETKV